MRAHVVAAALAAAVLTATTGCSGDDGGGSANPAPTAGAPSGAAAPSKVPPSLPGRTPPLLNGVRPGAESKSKLDGSWAATTGKQKVALHLFRGAAAINAPYFCSGTIDGTGLIKLTCAGSQRERVSGKAVLGSGGKTLTVTWEGGLKDVFRRN